MAPSASPTSPKKTQSTDKSKKSSAKSAPSGGPDIRSFFSQDSNGGPSRPAPAPKTGTGGRPITIDDSDEEGKPTTSKHFTSKPGASTRVIPVVINDTPSPAPETKPNLKQKANGMKRKSVVASDSEEDVKPRRASTGGSRGMKKPKYAESSEEEEEEEEKVEVKRSNGKGSAGGKAKAKKEESPMDVDDESEEESGPEEDDDDDFEEDESPSPKGKKKAKARTSAPKKPPAKKSPAKRAAPAPKAATKSPKTPKKAEPEEEPKAKPKVDFRAIAAARAAGPKAPGSKEIPDGQPDCLSGLTFVFTGELDSLGRDQAVELAKRFGGRVTGGPSKMTNYVVVGENAGAKKLETIHNLKIQTLNEDEFLELIRTRDPGEVDEKTKKAREKQEKDIEKQVQELEKREKEEESLRRRKEAALAGTGLAAKKLIPASAQLWTTKYAPQNMKEICGNKAPVERLKQWLEKWPEYYAANFKKPGKDGLGIYRAVLISGPPGIGKTTSAHLVAKMTGYTPLELNASDARSKKLVENSTNIDNASLDGFFAGKGLKSTAVIGDVRIDSRTCLIMDEVDGMSAGDRGGVGALNALIKKTKIPMILICNDRSLQKMKPLLTTCFNMTFRRLQASEVRSRIMSIAHKEKLKIKPEVIDQLIQGANSDIRQVLNMLSTFKLGKDEMDFDEGKQLLRINEKNMLLTPFTIIEKLSSPYSFSRTNHDTLNEKMELYFHDFSMVPLFEQEHYLKTQPSAINSYQGQEQTLKHLELVSKAADSISDGDLVERMVRGSEQHWSLLPLHAVTSTVRPAFFTYGPMRNTGGPGSWGPSFPSWLGQNSKQTKLQRFLTDIQIRMRLRVSGSRQEIREQYMPILATKLVQPLVSEGSEAIEEVIQCMDDYYIGKEDWDAFVELGIDSMKDDMILKQILSATKSAFTRQYNKSDHPIAFHKGDMFASAKRKIADMGPAPDNEDVFEDDEAPEEDADSAKAEDDDDQVNDVSKDKLIKNLAAKGKGKAKKK